jgi:glycosyltransferase involved in cell wall biosynthesis
LAKVSVIIPTFNRAQFLGETLESILAQTFKDWECLIIDDGSTDYTEELAGFYLEKDARISYHKRPQNKLKGANACRNYGFELSKGDCILWYDSDDVMKEDKLQVQTHILKKSNCDFCIAYSEIFDDRSGKLAELRFEKLTSEKLMLDYAKMKIGWMTPGILWTRKYLENLDKLFDEELQAAQEWEFHLRVISFGPSFYTIEKSLDLIRRHSNSITYASNNFDREWFYFLARLKIYRNSNLNLDTETRGYLKTYLYNRFKKMVRSKYNFTFTAYQNLILKDNELNFLIKLNAILAIFSFKLTGKGNFFLKKIGY